MLESQAWWTQHRDPTVSYILTHNHIATFNGRQFTGVAGLNVTSRNGAVRFETPTMTPTTTTGERVLYVNSSNQLIFDDGSSKTTLGGVGGGGVPSFETLFAADATMTVTPDTAFTIAGNRSTATDVVVLTNVGGGSGQVLQITNSGTGKDIQGTSATWNVTKLGVGTFAGLSISGTSSALATTGAAVWTLLDSSATSLSIGASGATSMMVFDTTGGSEVVKFGNNIQVTDGLATLISSSNTVSNLLVTNNTITTYGANATDAGAVVIRSTSLTTGSLLQLSLSDTNNAGGFYLNCRDSVGGTNDFTVGENGVVVMLGTAASNALTISNGDVLLSDGSITLTDADNAASLSVTNDTVTTAALVAVTGSGAFTGSTTSSFVSITPTGLTTGTALYIAGAAATTASVLVDVTTSTTTGSVMRLVGTGVQLDGAATGVLTMVADSATTAGATAGRGLVSLSADGLTTGTGLDVTSTSLGLTSGELANFEHICSGTITGAKTDQLVDVTSSRTHTSTTTISDDYDALSVVRTNVINNGTTGTLNAAGSALYIENVSTQTAGTLEDTANGIEVVMTGGAEAQGYGLSITHSGTTVGRAISVAASQTTGTVMLVTANSLTTTGVGVSIAGTDAGITSGSLLRVSTGTAGLLATNGIVSIRGTGAHTSTANVGLLDVQSAALVGTAANGTLVNFKTTSGSQVDVTALNVEMTTTTTGFTGNFVKFTGTSTTGAGNLILVTGGNTSAGTMLKFVNNALTSGQGILFAHTTSVISDGGSMLRLSSSSVDTGGATNGCVLDIGSTGSTAGTVVKITDTALTTGVALGLALTGVYTGTGLVNVSAANTSGCAVLITASSMTSGSGLTVTSASTDTGAFACGLFKVTATQAVAAAPLKTSNVAVNNSKFTKVLVATDGTKTVTIWLDQDGTTPNGTLSGTAGDICLNGPSNRTFYCTGTTSWSASNA